MATPADLKRQPPIINALSIVVAASKQSGNERKIISNLIEQARNCGAEIILVGSFSRNISQELDDSKRIVTLLPHSEVVPLEYLLAQGIVASRGAIVALTDIDTEPAANWIESILREHESDEVVIGGVVDVNGRLSLSSWASYFCDYGQFMSPLTSGTSNALSGNNISFKRSALPSISILSEHGFWKTLWCQSLEKRGVELKLNSNIRVTSAKRTDLNSLLARKFESGRNFAKMRAMNIGSLRRITFAIGATVLPLVLLKRTFATVLPKRRFRRELFASAPFMTLAFAAWSLGEFVGGFAGNAKRQADKQNIVTSRRDLRSSQLK